jgi:hypothetical protein
VLVAHEHRVEVIALGMGTRARAVRLHLPGGAILTLYSTLPGFDENALPLPLMRSTTSV